METIRFSAPLSYAPVSLLLLPNPFLSPTPRRLLSPSPPILLSHSLLNPTEPPQPQTNPLKSSISANTSASTPLFPSSLSHSTSLSSISFSDFMAIQHMMIQYTTSPPSHSLTSLTSSNQSLTFYHLPRPFSSSITLPLTSHPIPSDQANPSPPSTSTTIIASLFSDYPASHFPIPLSSSVYPTISHALPPIAHHLTSLSTHHLRWRLVTIGS